MPPIIRLILSFLGGKYVWSWRLAKFKYVNGNKTLESRNDQDDDYYDEYDPPPPFSALSLPTASQRRVGAASGTVVVAAAANTGAVVSPSLSSLWYRPASYPTAVEKLPLRPQALAAAGEQRAIEITTKMTTMMTSTMKKL